MNRNESLRQLGAALSLLVAVVAIPFGLLMVVFGILADQTADEGPTCDGEPMTPGTECWSISTDDVSVLSYDQAVEQRRQGVESGEGMLETGVAVVIDGISATVLFKVCMRSAADAGSAQNTPSGPSIAPVSLLPDHVPPPADHRHTEHGADASAEPRSEVDSAGRRPSPAESDAHARSALRQGDIGGAVYWYQLGANAGDTAAMNNLGRLLQGRVAGQNPLQRWRHRHRNRGDLVEAGLWFRKAAEAGNPEAMRNLAAVLRRDRQFRESESWEERAIEAGTGSLGDDAPEPTGLPSEAWSTMTAPDTPAPTRAHHDHNELLTMVMGDRAVAERLITYEMDKDPAAGRATATGRALGRLRHDRNRQG